MINNKKFDREKAKIGLENIVLGKIKDNYLKESHKVKEKNEISKKSDGDAQLVEEQLKKLDEIRLKLDNVNRLAEPCQKLTPAKKQEIMKYLGELNNSCLTFVEKKKSFPVKPNEWIKVIIKETYEMVKDLEKQLIAINSAGCCGSGKYIKTFEEKCKRFGELQYFWYGLSHSEAREGFQEVHIVPNFNENEFRKEIRNYIEEHFPHEQEPKVIIKEKEIIKSIETESKPDFLRVAHELLFGFGRTQDIFEAMKIYLQEAEKHIVNVDACNALGKIYMEGKYVPRDFNKARFYYERSISKDPNDLDAEALYQLGVLEEKGCLEGGQTMEERISNAKEYYLAAAEKGHKDAMCDLAYLYREEQNLEEALKFYTKAKKGKHPRSLNNLGKLCMENVVHEKVNGDNYRKAIKYFALAAEYGNIKALFNLGVCYEKGIGVDQNLEKAYCYFKDSAKKGDLEGKLFYSSYILRNALGTNHDDDFLDAFRMLNEVITENPKAESAYYYLGYLYEYGFGVGKDFKLALIYYNKAAELGYAPASNKLGNFFYSGYGVEKIDMAKAVEYYKKAAALNDVDALINLGVLYENGNEYLKKDVKHAIEIFEKASNELGDSRGFLNIGHLYAEGKYGENQHKAIEFYEKAAGLGDKLALELLAAKGKTHMKTSYVEEKDNLKKSQIGKFCDDNLILNGREDFIQSSLPAVKKGKDQTKMAIINGHVTSGLPKQFLESTNPHFNAYKKEENMFNEMGMGNIQSERHDLDQSFENQRLIENNPSHRQAKNKIPMHN